MEYGNRMTGNLLENPTTRTRKAYTKPELIVFGDVVALTRNMACGGNDGPAGQFLS